MSQPVEGWMVVRLCLTNVINMITIKSEKKNYGINFPTEIEEITPEILNEITKKIVLPNHYCVVMLCFKTKLFNFVLATNSKKTTTIPVVPVMAKISESDSNLINSVVGNKLIIERTCLERGVHLRLPIMISTDNARDYINSDSELVKSIVTTKNFIHSLNNIVVVEFKILPVSDITASINSEITVEDPFVYKAESAN